MIETISNQKTISPRNHLQQWTKWIYVFVLSLIGLLILFGLFGQAHKLAAAEPAGQEFTVTCANGVGPVNDLIASFTAANSTTEADAITIADGAGCTFAFEQAVGIGTALPEIFTAMTINGNGATFTRSPDANPMRFFWVHYTSLTLNDLTLTNGEAGAQTGGAIYADHSDLALNNVIMNQNGGRSGSAIYLWSGHAITLTVNHSQFEHNYAQEQGGAIYAFGNQVIVQINDSHFTDNQTIEGSGGALYTAGQTTVTDSIFQQNKAHHYSSKGGAIYAEQALEIRGSEFFSNSLEATNTYNMGGAVYASADLTVADSTFHGNTSYSLGGAAAVFGSLTVEDSLFSKNQNFSNGGAIYAAEDDADLRFQAATTIRNSQFISNTGYNGGGLEVYAMNALTVENSAFIGNAATDYGGLRASVTQTLVIDSRFERNTADYYHGAFYLYGSKLTMVRTDVLSNTAGSEGGGGTIFGDTTIHDSRFIGNQASRYYADTGALRVYGPLNLQRNLFLHNSAGRNGSGLSLYLPTSGGSSILYNNVWADNVVLNGPNNDGIGANIYVYFPSDGGDLTMAHNTIANSVGFSNDVAVQFHGSSGGAFLYNNIIANHQVGVEQEGPSVTTANNLYFSNITDEVGVTTSGAHILGEDPRFVHPAGADYSLLPDSPAIDVAPFIGVTDDVRGIARPQGDGYDIGAYEFTNIPPTPEDYLLFIPLAIQS